MQLEKTDFPKLCQNKGLGDLFLKIKCFYLFFGIFWGIFEVAEINTEIGHFPEALG